ncbi:hypothetical protein V6N13_051168 [Hibiscus sabdariffa]
MGDYESPEFKLLCELIRALFWSTQQGLASECGRLIAQREGLREVVLWNSPPPGWHLVHTDGDSKDVLRLFYSNSDQGRYISIVNHIDALIKRDWLVQCCHIHRNDNRVADALTKLADLSHLDCLCFSIPSSSVAGLLQADIDVLTVS